MESLNLILGFGSTGASVVRYFSKLDQPFIVVDSRKEPPGLKEIEWISKEKLHLGKFNPSILQQVNRIIVSPGISFNNPVLVKARELKKEINTDIDLYLKHAKTKIILVTGTNGKTTVVTMAEQLLERIYGKNLVLALGNIGKPVLDFVFNAPKISIIEISSFHLQLSNAIFSHVGVLLNIGQDHLDRHLSMEDYVGVKKRVLSNTRVGLFGVNGLDLDLSEKDIIFSYHRIFELYDNLLVNKLDKSWPFHEKENIKAAISIYLALEHLYQNIDITNHSSIKHLIIRSINILRSFERLPHRYEVLGSSGGITFINDSKSTNISSTLVALDSAERLYGDKKVHLICGGVSKGQNFKNFLEGIKALKKVYLFGKDASFIKKNINTVVEVILVSDLFEAMEKAKNGSSDGDIILLSPACASTDMYLNFQERGREFTKLAGF